MKLIYSGKAKDVYQIGNSKEIAIVYTDNATAGNGEKAAVFASKGALNVQISAIIYKYLMEHGVQTHLISTDVSTNTQVCKFCQLIPLEVIIRNKVAGSMARKMGVEEGTKLLHPIFELSYKEDSLGDPFINDDYATALGICTETELAHIKEVATNINQLLITLLNKCNIDLIDYKLEFGRDEKDNVLLIDEISPDTMRLWDQTTGTKLDKDNFRKDLGDLIQSYQEVLNRLEECNV